MREKGLSTWQWIALGLCSLGLCLMLLATADQTWAGSIKLPKTGQTSSYHTGDDGDLEMGVAWPDPRFTSHGDGTITDNLTGLMWGADGKCFQNNYGIGEGYGETGWQTALDTINTMNAGNYLLCSAGYNDWRLPNVNEMYSLLNHQKTSISELNYSWLQNQGFSNLRNKFYWTSTSGPNTLHQAKVVALHELSVSSQLKIYPFNFLIVRGTSNGVVSVPSTKQQRCWHTNGTQIGCDLTGQDGELQKGADWPIPRFTIRNDTETVQDNLTGLIWMRDTNYAHSRGHDPDSQGNGKMTWAHAMDFIDAVNAGTFPSPGDFTD